MVYSQRTIMYLVQFQLDVATTSVPAIAFVY